jgi:hypothetical protein
LAIEESADITGIEEARDRCTAILPAQEAAIQQIREQIAKGKD